MPVYPWLETQLARLLAMRERMPHALLVAGPAGTGKQALAQALVTALLCRQPVDGHACGECSSCRWLAAGNHPDFLRVEPQLPDNEEDSVSRQRQKPIQVEQVRVANEFLHLSSHQGGMRILLVQPAEAMNVAAANALLKTLEEPPAGSVLILVSHHPARLLPTVISRCHQVRVPVPDVAQAAAWLQTQGIVDTELCLALANGSPLQALEQADPAWLEARTVWIAAWQNPHAEHPVSQAVALAKLDVGALQRWLTGFQQWMHDLISLRMGGGIRYHIDCAAGLRALADRLEPVGAFAFHQRLLDMRKSLLHTLNQQMVLEDVLLDYVALF